MAIDPKIYNHIWEADENKLSVSVRGKDGKWVDSEADILLDHQVRAGDRRDIDLATRPLFSKLNGKKVETDIFRAYKDLLDNYLVNYRDPEDYTDQEKEEDYRFINLIIETGPVGEAFEYITKNLGKNISRDQFVERLWSIWFAPYTNYFGNRPTEFASGFEHVFVGEGKFQRGEGLRRGEVSGYHDWYKFYIDESQGRVDFRGTKYNLQGQPEPRNPNVVTLQMVWNLMDTDGNVTAELYKKRGGFFVGISPECLMALGTVGYFESIQGLTVNDRRNVQIQGSSFNLVIYRGIRQDGERGKHMRSFFPEYLGDGAIVPEPVPGPVVVRPSTGPSVNDGHIVIVRSMPNPPGDDKTGEWVVLKNTTTELIDLAGWRMTDKLGRGQSLGGSLDAGEEKQFNIDRSQVGGMMLGNSGGRIQVVDSEGGVVAVVSYARVTEGEVLEF